MKRVGYLLIVTVIVLQLVAIKLSLDIVARVYAPITCDECHAILEGAE